MDGWVNPVKETALLPTLTKKYNINAVQVQQIALMLTYKVKNCHLSHPAHNAPLEPLAQLDQTHNPSWYKIYMYKDCSLCWHPGGGMNFVWLSEQLSL